jgi:hypothetical protein
LKTKTPRVGLYRAWTADIDEGWTRWILEQYGFAPITIHNGGMQASHLLARFDAIILPDAPPKQILNGFPPGSLPGQYVGGIGEQGVESLREFVAGGGTLVTFNNASLFAIEQLGLPVTNVLANLKQDDFYSSASSFRVPIFRACGVCPAIPRSCSSAALPSAPSRVSAAPSWRLILPMSARSRAATCCIPNESKAKRQLWKSPMGRVASFSSASSRSGAHNLMGPTNSSSMPYTTRRASPSHPPSRRLLHLRPRNLQPLRCRTNRINTPAKNRRNSIVLRFLAFCRKECRRRASYSC